jgi:hypothetical protein
MPNTNTDDKEDKPDLKTEALKALFREHLMSVAAGKLVQQDCIDQLASIRSDVSKLDIRFGWHYCAIDRMLPLEDGVMKLIHPAASQFSAVRADARTTLIKALAVMARLEPPPLLTITLEGLAYKVVMLDVPKPKLVSATELLDLILLTLAEIGCTIKDETKE